MKRNATLLAALISAATLVAPTFATTRADISANFVDFQVDSNYRSLTLHVSGADFDFSKTFEADERAQFAPAEHGLADGTYTYELVVNPFAPDVEKGERAPERQMTSGAFTVSAGTVVDPSISERAGRAVAADNDETGGLQGASAAAQVIATDLIVDGSACIGIDCTSSENFGFDTLRLKENNLRIKFDDTSGSASFPNNDWQITANDSSNGGANKFSIDDVTNSKTPFTIEANSPSHTLYVASEGRIGVGTSTPVVGIHHKDGNTPTLRLEQDGSSGFQSQVWDLAGNETNFFVRDVTNSSKLPFRIKPGAPDDSIFIKADGAIGLGTDSPTEELHVKRTSGNAAFRLETTDSTGADWIVRAQTIGQLQFRDDDAGTIPFRIGPGAQSSLLSIGLKDNGGTVDTDQVTIEGVLSVIGSIEVDGSVVHADFVFENDYALPTIEEAAAFMFQEKHLPSMPKAPEGLVGPVDLVGHQMGMLEELEKAHIYIGQLNGRIGELDGEIEAKDLAIETLIERLDRLEQLLANR